MDPWLQKNEGPQFFFFQGQSLSSRPSIKIRYIDMSRYFLGPFEPWSEHFAGPRQNVRVIGPRTHFISTPVHRTSLYQFVCHVGLLGYLVAVRTKLKRRATLKC